MHLCCCCCSSGRGVFLLPTQTHLLIRLNLWYQRCIWEQSLFFFFSMGTCFFFFVTYLFLRRMVSLQLQPKPRIDYVLKAVGGSLTAMPGLSDMIDVWMDFPSIFFYLCFISFYEVWAGKEVHICLLSFCRIQWRHWSLTCSNGHIELLFHWVESTWTSG